MKKKTTKNASILTNPNKMDVSEQADHKTSMALFFIIMDLTFRFSHVLELSLN